MNNEGECPVTRCNHQVLIGSLKCEYCGKQIYGIKGECEHLWVYKGGYSRCIACGDIALP